MRLLVGSEHLWVLNRVLQPLITLPVLSVTSVLAEQIASGWIVRINCVGGVTQIAYSGLFARHLAQLAQNAIQSVLQPSLIAVPRSRAARA
ncbi:MAG: hypothetical protein NVS9B4_20980 [Candidatus Acidiferrum sp.]